MIILDGNVAVTEPIAFALEELKRHCQNYSLVLELQENTEIGKQGYRIERVCNKICLMSSEDAGFLYGILDIADAVTHGTTEELFQGQMIVPYIRQRGIKFNIPLDARTPSYSDASDSASKNIVHMWEKDFWAEFLDRMALNKYNVLSLWTLSPFPSLVRIPEFPLTALEDVKRSARAPKSTIQGVGMYSPDMEEHLVTVKRMSVDEKIKFWQWVMEYGKTRCIKIMIFTWNLFVYGTEHNSYGITNRQDNPVTKRYIYCGTKALMHTYPLLAGLGVTAGEDMLEDDTDIPFIAETYGRAVKEVLLEQPDREFHYIHRMQYARYDSIMSEYEDFPGRFGISFKYSQAHMYSDTGPGFICDFLREKAQGIKIWLTVRNDDFYMYRWGNPVFAAEYLQQMPSETMDGFYMGPDGFTWGRDYLVSGSEHKLVLEKMWYMFAIWGRLSYRPDLPEAYFVSLLEKRFDLIKSVALCLYESWKQASDIIPMLNCTHWHDFDFQWYPEGCCMYSPELDKLVFADIHEFVRCQSIPGGKYNSVSEYCSLLENNQEQLKVTPVEQANRILAAAEQSLSGVGKLSGQGGSADYNATLEDITALAYLGRYMGTKIKAAVQLQLYWLNGLAVHQEACVVLLREAAAMWYAYSAKSKSLYCAQTLTRMGGRVDLEAFNELADLDVLLAQERRRLV